MSKESSKPFLEPSIVSEHAFGVSPDKLGEIVLLMERDRTEQYKGAFEKVLHELKGGVYPGITGLIADVEVSAIYSKSPADIADCVAFLALSNPNCHTVFSTGSIGGLGEGIEMADLLIVDEAVGTDGYSLFLARRDGRLVNDIFSNIIKPVGYIADLIEKGVREVADTFSINSHRGRIFTVPGVSLETEEFLRTLKARQCLAIDMETAPFYAACREYGLKSMAIHWVTDLPLIRNFFYRFTGDPNQVESDWNKKHPLWLNMANILTSILESYIKYI